MVTLTSPQVGDFVSAHFVAAYQQKGDFDVKRVNGNLQKNGGNVVTYFCTPGLRVLHFVVGPVTPDRFITEAQFARDVYDEAIAAGEKGTAGRPGKSNEPMPAQRKAVAALHTKRAGGRSADALQAFQGADYQRLRQRYGRRQDPSQLAAQRWESLVRSADHIGGNNTEHRVHRLLAYEPLPPVAAIDTPVFRYFAGQPVNDQDGSVGRAMKQIERATAAGRPMMLLFHENWYSWRNSRSRAMLRAGQAAKLIPQYEVVNLPAEEMPALSARLPGFTVPEATKSNNATIVLIDYRQNLLATVSDQTEPAEFARILALALSTNDLVRAEKLVAEKRILDARRHLVRAHKSADQAVAQKAGELLASLDVKQPK